MDEENNKKVMKCVRDYVNGNETQQFYCQKHDVNLHAFKRFWAKYKESHKEEIRQAQAKKEAKAQQRELKLSSVSENNVFQKRTELRKTKDSDKRSDNRIKKRDMNGGNNQYINNMKHNETYEKPEIEFKRTASGVRVVDPTKYFNVNGLLERE
jgi:transposase-like protein